jgi:hypothetical protein
MRSAVQSTGIACAILFSSAAWGQTSRLCMVSWNTNDVVVIQNGVLVDQWLNSGPFKESGLAVLTTIKMVGRNANENGAEYALDGTPLGGGPYFNPSFMDLYDGATNGLHNWSIGHNDFPTNYAVVIGDADWNGLGVAFVPTRRSSGITFAGSTGTLWIANNEGGFTGLQEYDASGNLLTDLPLPFIAGAGYGLAWDPADNTLWLTGPFGGPVDAYQLDFAGTILQEVDVPGISGSWVSAECLPPPEVGPLRGSDVAADNLLVIDTSTGHGAILGPLADDHLAALAWDPNHGILYGSSSTTDGLFRIDPNTGATTFIGPFGGGVTLMHGLEYDAIHNVLYGVTSFVNLSLYSIDVTTGAATYVGNHGKPTLDGLAFDRGTGTMYAAETSEQNLYTIDLGTGALHLVGPFNGPGAVQIGVGLAFDPVHGLLASDNKISDLPDDELYSIDPATGQATLVGPINHGNVLGLAFITEVLCPWDCGDHDGSVGVVDFLAVLAQWGGPGPCDFDGGGVGVTDFLTLLAQWGPCPEAGLPEDEPNCGLPQDVVNGGCNASPSVFSPITCGQTYFGTAAFDGSTRDTDWYEITVEEPTIFTWSATPEFAAIIGLVETDPPGAGDCADHTGYLNPFALGGAGETVSVTTDCLPPGTYWFFVAPDFSEVVTCPAPYEATLTCEHPCVLPVQPPEGTGGAVVRIGVRSVSAVR